MDAASQASSIISKLQAYDFAGIDELFSDYLQPLSSLISPKPQLPKTTKKTSQSRQRAADPLSSSSIRSLAKTFMPFLTHSLSLLPKRLSESPKHPNTQLYLPQLLLAYSLSLDCLDAISSQLSGKPYSVHLQRARFIQCLLRWGTYDDAVREGLRVLKALVDLKLDGSKCKLKMGQLAPHLLCSDDNANAIDADLVHLIVDIVVFIAHSVSLSKTKDAGKYTGLLILLNEVRPWLRFQDACASYKQQLKLLTHMKTATIFLATESKHFEEDMIAEFCRATFNEYIQLLNSQNSQGLRREELEDFVRFVSNYTGKCRLASTKMQGVVAMHLLQCTSNFSQDLAYLSYIQRLYAMGLYLSEFSLQTNDCHSPDSGSPNCVSSVMLPECWNKLKESSPLLSSGKKYYSFNIGKYNKPHKCECGNSVGKGCPSSNCDSNFSESSTANGADYLPYHLNALKFLCGPLAEFVNSRRKSLVAVKAMSHLGDALKLIHEALLEYCSLFPHCQSEKDAHGQIDSTVISISVAAFTLSLKLDLNIKGSKGLLKYLISDNCKSTLQPRILKSIIAKLYNIFVEFFRDGQLKEASKAGKLCCLASWTHCLLLCEMLVAKAKLDWELSESMITESLDEACKFSNLVLDVFHRAESHKLEKVVVSSLEKWSLARSLFRKLPCPVGLIKHWVKKKCTFYKNTDASAPILGSYLMRSSCTLKHSLSTEGAGIILEQELSEYEGMSNLYPKFSQSMQMEIIDILLNNIYDSGNSIRKACILVKKAKLSRASGIDGLEKCICCLSEGIDLINHSYGNAAFTQEKEASMSHQLAIIYCLRAICAHEANPSSKIMFEDIHKAVKLWLKIDVADQLSNGVSDMGCDYVLLLLYHIADLLSIKGEMDTHLDVLNLIIKVFKRMDSPLEKCLSLMWASRRVNHAFCVVPVSEAFIMALSGQYGKDAESLDFWMSSLKDSRPLLVGLQQNFSYLSSLFPLAFCQHISSLHSEVSVDEVKVVASDLFSKAPLTEYSAFLAGYLYYDLSERLSASGHMIEALLCATEAHQLRGKLLRERFSYSLELCEGKQDENGNTIKKPSRRVSHIAVSHKYAMGAWPYNANSQDSEGFMLTPWNVLQCYLESTLQVGIIHETLGNGAEAESLFRQGLSISDLQGLPLFTVAFSSYLGKLYLGKCHLDEAQEELGNAEKVLAVQRNFVKCPRCLLMLECTIMEQLGNLCRKRVGSATENPFEFAVKRLISLEKGDLAVWLEETSLAYTMPQDEAVMNAESGFRTDQAPGHLCVTGSSLPEKTKTDTKRSRKTKQASESLSTVGPCIVDCNSRFTRSRKQHSHSNGVDSVETVENISRNYSKTKQESKSMIVSQKVNCQKCFSKELKDHGSLTCVIQLRWEFVRRRQILRLLIGLGNHDDASLGVPRLYKIYAKCISILVGGNDCKCLSTSLDLEFIGKEQPGDALAVEHAEICYNLCWLSLKILKSNNIRSAYCVPCYQMPQVMSMLMLSFVLSREVPLLFQKVSRLLALTYVVSSVKEEFSHPMSSGKGLRGNFWAAYFHQASVGAHHDVRLLSALYLKHKIPLLCKAKGTEAADPSSMTTDVFTLLRAAPESMKEIEACVEKYFQTLPCSTIVCISLLEGSYASLLEELIHYPAPIYGWMLLSHMNADNEPAVVLLPLSSILQGEERSPGCSILAEKNLLRDWHSPWGCSALVDTVAPLFRLILRENYDSSFSTPGEDTERHREKWWSRRRDLDKLLHKLLRDMEESWYGMWRYLLLGRWSDSEPLNSVVRELVQEIKLRCKSYVNEGVLKLVLGGIKAANLQNERIPWLFLQKGCYISCIENCDKEGCDSQNEACDGGDYVSYRVIELLIAAVNKLESEYCTRRMPVILVLDSNVQMLPLENMPILREQEVYRMPSVASIFAALERRSILNEAVRHGPRFPVIDPLDAFYVLNPSGDLSRTQAEFEEWFRLQNMEGKTGTAPSTEELTGALENHDLFLYLGHGSGAQYMPMDKIQKLDKCAATLLMGCSSGSLTLNGSYAPVGAALSYILAGSPLVVANLWEVTDLEIDRFAKDLLQGFLDERSMASSGCVQCSILAEELKCLSMKEGRGNTKKGGRPGRKKKPETDDRMADVSGGYCFRHKLGAGYFVSKARKACRLPYLIGAAPVCYGVPTGIWKKKDV